MKQMNKNDLVKLGFEPIKTFTVMNSYAYALGRHRHLSVSNVGTPNEMMFISETSDQDEKVITDLIAIHNYDYDGYLKAEKVAALIDAICN